jgi:hypothetical protein
LAVSRIDGVLHAQEQCLSLFRQERTLGPAIFGIDFPPDDSASRKPRQDAGGRRPVDPDFPCQSNLVHSGLRKQHLHDTRLHRRGAKRGAFLRIDREIDLMYASNEDAWGRRQSLLIRLLAVIHPFAFSALMRCLLSKAEAWLPHHPASYSIDQGCPALLGQ